MHPTAARLNEDVEKNNLGDSGQCENPEKSIYLYRIL